MVERKKDMRFPEVVAIAKVHDRTSSTTKPSAATLQAFETSSDPSRIPPTLNTAEYIQVQAVTPAANAANAANAATDAVPYHVFVVRPLGPS